MNPGSIIAAITMAALLGGCTVCPNRFSTAEEVKNPPQECRLRDMGEDGVIGAMPFWF